MSDAPEFQLISFAACPFVQRAVLTLLEKDADFSVTYIDLQDKPDWFLDISPRGKVPVMVAEGTPLFESQAICEFLEEVLPDPPLMPEDPIDRARDRAFFAMASEDLFGPIWLMQSGSELEVVQRASDKLEATLARIEEELYGDYLSGDGSRFGMADVGCVPVFTRIAFLEALGTYEFPTDKLPRVDAWRKRLLDRQTVEFSVPPEFEPETLTMMTRLNALLLPEDKRVTV